MSRKKTKKSSNKIVGRCLESDAHAQTIDEGFAFLDRPILKPREVLAYQWALRNIAIKNMRIKSESTREAVDNGTSYFSDGSIRVKAHILCGIATDVHFASDDQDASIDRIMMSFVKVYNEQEHRWHPVDSHLWLFMDKLTVRQGEGWEEREDGDGFGVALGDRVIFLAEDRVYDGPKGMRRHGAGEWSVISSRLMYGTNGKKGIRICEVPRKAVTDAYLMFFAKRGEQVGITLMNNEEWAECQERCQAAAIKEPWSLIAYLEQSKRPYRRCWR